MAGPDVILALVEYLKSKTTVTTLTGTNIYDFDLPSTLDFNMAQKVILVRPHGGPSGFRTLQLNDTRIQLWCYGESQHLAYTVYNAAAQAFKDLQSQKFLDVGTYVHWCNSSSGPIPFQDAESQWPYNISSFLCRSSDLAITN